MKIVEDSGPRSRGAGSYGIAPASTTRRLRPGTSRAEALGHLLGRAALVLALLVSAGASSGCSTTPISGSTALIPFPVSYDVELGNQAVAEYVDQSKVVESGPQATMVDRVMQRLVQAAGEDANPYDWSVRLVDEPQTVNAFALPGGPMAVYTGILPVTQDEAGLAVVMGHEIGHVLARHGMQRMTRQVGASLVLSLFDQSNWTQLAQYGYQFAVEMPFGRGDESEADEIGLILMARAGYDPRTAPAFWGRMAEMTGDGPPEWLSTHPSHDTRREHLEELMPRALEEYRSAGGGDGGGSGSGLKQYDGR